MNQTLGQQFRELRESVRRFPVVDRAALVFLHQLKRRACPVG